MPNLSRRTFLKTTALAAGAGLASGLTRSVWAEPVGAGGDLRLGVIGLRSKGADHVRHLQTLAGVRIVALCDVDPRILSGTVEKLKGGQIAPFATTDARELLARADVDAVVIAAPNHWHALLTIWACQAGKDVYVEKPMSHTVWEGRKMIEAAAKYGRIVQVGTQHRSDPGLLEASQYLREGHCGRILHVHAVYFNLRKDIGYRLPWYPDWLDYDRFCGPSPMAPLERASLHYDWHWSWATGNGDLGNNGVHVLDMGLFFAGHKEPPPRMLCLGGRYVVTDRAETPNAIVAVYDYPEIPFIFEHRGLPAKTGVAYMDQTCGIRFGIVVQCEGGYFAGMNGGAVYDTSNAIVKKFPGDGGAGHMANFLGAVRSRRAGDLIAPLDVAFTAARMCHFGNISYRIGAPAKPARAFSMLEAVPAAGPYLEGLTSNLAANGVDLGRTPLQLGQWVQVEGDTVLQVGSGREDALERARYLLRETHRPPYVIPETV